MSPAQVQERTGTGDRADTVRFVDVVRSEWIKLARQRSTFWSLLSAMVLIVGLGAVFALAYGAFYDTSDEAERAAFDPTTISLSGVWFGQLAIGVLGVLMITSEYASGSIRSSLAAVPRRARLLAAKAVVFGGVTLLLGEVAAFAAFFVGQPLLAREAPHAAIGDPDVLRAIVGSGLYLAVLGLFCLAVGTVLRHTAGSIATVVAVVFIVPTITGSLPGVWQRTVSPWMPTNAGSALWEVVPLPHQLPPWAGFAVFVGYTVAVGALGVALFLRRDA